MKKFVAGFVVGGLLFGTVTAFAQDLKNVVFNIKSVEVDGKAVNLKSTSKPFTFNGQAYIPSYMLNELGYIVERTKDNSGLVLRSLGQAFYPVEEKRETSNVNVIRIKNVSTANAKLNIAYKTGHHMLRDDTGKSYDNYVHIEMDTDKDKASFANFNVPLDEKFRRFGGQFHLITQNTDAPLNGSVTLTAYITDDKNQETIAKSWTLDASKKTEDMTLSLRYAKGMRFKLTSTHKGQVKVALLNARFVK